MCISHGAIFRLQIWSLRVDLYTRKYGNEYHNVQSDHCTVSDAILDVGQSLQKLQQIYIHVQCTWDIALKLSMPITLQLYVSDFEKKMSFKGTDMEIIQLR